MIDEKMERTSSLDSPTRPLGELSAEQDYQGYLAALPRDSRYEIWLFWTLATASGSMIVMFIALVQQSDQDIVWSFIPALLLSIYMQGCLITRYNPSSNPLGWCALNIGGLIGTAIWLTVLSPFILLAAFIIGLCAGVPLGVFVSDTISPGALLPVCIAMGAISGLLGGLSMGMAQSFALYRRFNARWIGISVLAGGLVGSVSGLVLGGSLQPYVIGVVFYPVVIDHPSTNLEVALLFTFSLAVIGAITGVQFSKTVETP